MAQRLLKVKTSVVQATHDGADRDIERLSDLFIREFLDLTQHDEGSVFFAQRVERFIELFAQFSLLKNFFGINSETGRQDLVRLSIIFLELVIEFNLVLCLFSTIAVDGEVDSDVIDPGVKMRSRLILCNIVIHADKGFLRDFASIFLIAHDSVCSGDNAFVVEREQLFESPLIVLLNARNELIREFDLSSFIGSFIHEVIATNAVKRVDRRLSEKPYV